MLSGYHTTVQIEFRHSRDAPSLSSPLLSLTLTLDPNPTPTQPPFRLLSVSWRRECAAVTRVLVLDSGQQHRQHGRNPPPDDDAPLSLDRVRSFPSAGCTVQRPNLSLRTPCCVRWQPSVRMYYWPDPPRLVPTRIYYPIMIWTRRRADDEVALSGQSSDKVRCFFSLFFLGGFHGSHGFQWSHAAHVCYVCAVSVRCLCESPPKCALVLARL